MQNNRNEEHSKDSSRPRKKIKRSYVRAEQYWNAELNIGKPSDYAPASDKRCHFIHKSECGCSHQWETQFKNMTMTPKTDVTGCPICQGTTNYKPCCSNFKGALTTNIFFKTIQHQWSPKNATRPEDHYPNSRIDVWWEHISETCGHKHEWKKDINLRIQQKSGCPQCANKHFKYRCCASNTISQDTKLMKLWDKAKNDSDRIFPENFTHGSQQRAHWTCSFTCQGQSDCKHEWMAPVHQIAYGHGCPHCNTGSSKIVPCCKSKSLASEEYVDIVNEMHPDSRAQLGDLRLVYAKNNNIQITWVCKKATCCVHEWKTTLYHRISYKSGCPYCCSAQKRICCGNNIRALANWDQKEKLSCYIKENEFKPTEISICSNKRVKFRCNECKYIFARSLVVITKGNVWCPHCFPYGASRMACAYMDEYEKQFHVKVNHIHFLPSGKAIGIESHIQTSVKKYKVDGFVAGNKNTIIEFHGDYFHGNPAIFNPNDVFSERRKLTFGDRHKKTIDRMKILAEVETLHYVWENDFVTWQKNPSLPFPCHVFQ